MLQFRNLLPVYLFIAFLILPSYPLAQTIPTDEPGFTRFVADKMEKKVGDTAVTIKSPLTLSVGGLQANLDRIYLFCKSNSSACQAEIENYVKGVAGVLKDQKSPVTRDAVGIVIRTAEYIKQVQELFGRGGHVIPTNPIVEGLVAMPVLDTPRAVRPIDERDLKALNISREQLFDLARTNLEATLKPLCEVAKPVTSGQTGSITGSMFEVGRVAFHAKWAQLAQAQGGNLLIAVPTTDVVLYSCGTSNAEVDALRVSAKNTMAKASNPLSTIILRWTTTGWEIVPSGS